MRKPLTPLQAFAEDARNAAERASDVNDDFVSWLSVAQSADHLSVLDRQTRDAAIKTAAQLLERFEGKRPTMVHDTQPAPSDSFGLLVEQFRVAAEMMERAGCFELAYTTVSAICRLTSSADYVTSSLATLHLGRVARQMNDLSSAEDCYSTMLETSTRERDGPLAARGHIGLALLHDMRGNLPASEKQYLAALDLAAPMRGAYAAACQGLMTLAMTGGRLADALIYGWKLYDATENDIETRTCALADLAGIALRAGFPEAALRGYEHAMSLVAVPRLRMISLAGALRSSSRLGDKARVEMYDRALLIDIASANQPYDASLVLVYAAEGWATIGRLDVATVRLTASRELAERFGFNEYLFRADALEASWQERVNTAPSQWEDTIDESSEITMSNPAIAQGIERLETLAY